MTKLPDFKTRPEVARCVGCIYWDSRPRSTDGTVEGRSYLDFGECHRNPPSNTAARFPQTARDDWCGEWHAWEREANPA